LAWASVRLKKSFANYRRAESAFEPNAVDGWVGRRFGNPLPFALPTSALVDRLGGVARAAAEQHVRWVEGRAAVLELDDVVAEEAPVATVRVFAGRVFAAPPALGDESLDKRTPFARQVERVCPLRRRLRRPRVDDAKARR
jgi:hypothetical protein